VADQLSREEFLAHIEPLRKDIAELVELQRIANGRISKSEVRLAILEDRSPSRAGLIAGGTISGIVVVILEVARYLGAR
jgi:hypothetical protein